MGKKTDDENETQGSSFRTFISLMALDKDNLISSVRKEQGRSRRRRMNEYEYRLQD